MPTIDWSCAKDFGEHEVATLSCLPSIFEVVVFWALVFAGIVAFFLIILAGYKFMNSGGDPKAADSSRKTLTYGILGFVLILLSFLIIDLIAEVTGVSCLKNFNFDSCTP